MYLDIPLKILTLNVKQVSEDFLLTLMKSDTGITYISCLLETLRDSGSDIYTSLKKGKCSRRNKKSYILLFERYIYS